jgi:uncharacterized protein YerC
VASAEVENSDLSDVHECKHLHEPSADMTAVASAEKRNSDLSDVHECKHSMNHLLMTSAVQAQSQRTAMCQMFMSANTHEPSADMTGASKRIAENNDLRCS